MASINDTITELLSIFPQFEQDVIEYIFNDVSQLYGVANHELVLPSCIERMLELAVDFRPPINLANNQPIQNNGVFNDDVGAELVNLFQQDNKSAMNEDMNENSDGNDSDSEDSDRHQFYRNRDIPRYRDQQELSSEGSSPVAVKEENLFPDDGTDELLLLEDLSTSKEKMKAKLLDDDEDVIEVNVTIGRTKRKNDTPIGSSAPKKKRSPDGSSFASSSTTQSRSQVGVAVNRLIDSSATTPVSVSTSSTETFRLRVPIPKPFPENSISTVNVTHTISNSASHVKAPKTPNSIRTLTPQVSSNTPRTSATTSTPSTANNFGSFLKQMDYTPVPAAKTPVSLGISTSIRTPTTAATTASSAHNFFNAMNNAPVATTPTLGSSNISKNASTSTIVGSSHIRQTPTLVSSITTGVTNTATTANNFANFSNNRTHTTVVAASHSLSKPGISAMTTTTTTTTTKKLTPVRTPAPPPPPPPPVLVDIANLKKGMKDFDYYAKKRVVGNFTLCF